MTATDLKELVADPELTPVEKLCHMDRPDGFPAQVRQEVSGWVNYNGEKQRSMAYPLLNEKGVSAAKWFNAAGYRFPEHKHRQVEWLVVISGRMNLQLLQGGVWRDRQLGPGDGVQITANTWHKAEFPESCYFMAITIPGTDEWPAVHA